MMVLLASKMFTCYVSLNLHSILCIFQFTLIHPPWLMNYNVLFSLGYSFPFLFLLLSSNVIPSFLRTRSVWFLSLIIDYFLRLFNYPRHSYHGEYSIETWKICIFGCLCRMFYTCQLEHVGWLLRSKNC